MVALHSKLFWTFRAKCTKLKVLILHFHQLLGKIED